MDSCNENVYKHLKIGKKKKKKESIFEYRVNSILKLKYQKYQKCYSGKPFV